MFDLLFNLISSILWFPWEHPILAFIAFRAYWFYKRVQKNNGKLPWGSPPYAVKGLAYDEASSAPENPQVVIIGASSAGLAAAACLKDEGITSFVILEKTNVIGDQWLNKRYHRLHLHTSKFTSSLPFVDWPESSQIYPSRIEVAQYLRGYAEILGLTNHILFEHEVKEITFGSPNKITVEHKGQTKTFTPEKVISCVGEYSRPNIPEIKGRESFKKRIVTSEEYKRGSEFAGQKVLVVGFGNTGGELAIDLWEQNAKPTILARSPINVIPREVVQMFMITDPFLPRPPIPVADAIFGAINKWYTQGMEKFNVISPNPREAMGSAAVLRHHVGLMDIGIIDLIRKGEVPVIHSSIKELKGDSVIFENGESKTFDVIILATGYDQTSAAKNILKPEVASKLVNEHGVITSGQESPQPDLYFIGYNDFAGRFREISLESFRIAAEIKQKLSSSKKNN